MATNNPPYGDADNTTEDQNQNQFDTGKSIYDLIGMENIADILDDDMLNNIGRNVLSRYEVDKSSRLHREDSMENAMKAAMQITEEKNFPWPKASNIPGPLITNAALNFGARAFVALFGNDRVAKGKPVGNDDGQEVMVPAMNEFGQPVLDPNTGQIAGVPEIQGKGAKKEQAERVANYVNYQLFEEMEEWHPDSRRLCYALPVTGNMFRSVYYDKGEERPVSGLIYPKNLIVNYMAADLKTAPAITYELEMYRHEIIENMRLGVYKEFDFTSAKYELDKTAREKDDGATQTDSYNKPHVILEQHTRLDLDGDGYEEPYIVTYHYDTGKVLRIVANYREDRIIETEDGKIAKIKPEIYYVKYGFIPAFDGGIYDLGFGELLFHLNEAVSGTLNRMLDAGYLANTGGGFLGRGVRAASGAKRVRPGEWTPIDTRGATLRDSVMPIAHPEPSPVLFQLLGLIIEFGREMSANKDILSGDQGGALSGLQSLQMIEQGLTSFKEIMKGMHMALKEELKLMYRLNQVYLDDQKYFSVTEDQQSIARVDFDSKTADIVPASDPDMVTSAQKFAKAQVYRELFGDPLTDQVEVRERYYALLGIENPDSLISIPEPQPDPLIELSKAQIQIEGLKLELERAKGAVAAQETQAKIEKMQADAIKSIAEAEAKEAGSQMDLYKLELNELNRQRQQIQPQQESENADLSRTQ